MLVNEDIARAFLREAQSDLNSAQVSSDFAAVCADLPDAVRITRIAEQLERLGSRSEYPLFGDPNRPIWVPSEQLDQGDAQHALDGALFVFDRLSEHLATHHGVHL